MPLKAGDTFLLPGTGGASNPGAAHLMVVLVCPTASGDAIIVPLVSKKPLLDTTCELEKGDHPFIQHATIVSYAHTKLISRSAAEADIEEGRAIKKEPISDDILLKLQAGLTISDECPMFAIKAAQAVGLTAHLRRSGVIK